MPLNRRRRTGRSRADVRATGVLLVVTGLLTAAAALRPDGGLLGTATTAPVGVIGFVVLLGIGWAALVGRFAVRFREEVRHLTGPTPWAERLREAAVVLLPLAAAAVPVLMLVFHARSGAGPATMPHLPPETLPSHTKAPAPHPPVPAPPADPGPLGLLLAVLLGALALVAAAGLVVVAVRLLRRLRRRRRETPVLLPAAPPRPEDVLADAVVTARSALAGDDARAAVIACFAAMEGSLAVAGVPRHASDSPTELVARALSHQSIDPVHAHALTTLFHEARYSTHRMDDSQVRRARTALDAIAARLAGGTPAPPEPTPAAGAGPTGGRR